ncbi:MAG: nucleoside triphosphate pyrophosphohydrolase [Chthoniobacterales bacterium]
MSCSDDDSSSLSIARLRKIIAALRAPGGCPWDREQTHQSLRSSLLEECYEVIDAIEQNDDKNLNEELGDLLINVMMQAELASEREAFDLESIAHNACEKLVRRHPHVFKKGDSFCQAAELTSAQVLEQWNAIKEQEKSENISIKKISALDGVPHAFPALLHAQEIQKKAAKVGFDWHHVDDVLAKVSEELLEVEEALATHERAHQEEELGDLLFSIVNLSRSMKMDAELLLQQATKKFTQRFHAMESILQSEKRAISDCSFDELNKLWAEVKYQNRPT